MKKFFRNFYLLLIFLFLYAPIAVLIPAAVVTCRICSDPRVMRWLEQ